MQLDRRTFLKGAVATGAVAATGVALAGCSPQAEMPATTPEAETTASGSGLTYEIRDEKWAFEIAPEALDPASATETHEADIIVVGAGTAGLCTAVSAAEAGAKVICIAKGAGPVGRGGSQFAFHSKFREEMGLTDPVKPYPYLHRQVMGAGFDVCQDKWYKWAQHSEETMNWMLDIMAEPGKLNTTLEQICHDAATDESALEWQPIATHGWVDPEQPEVGAGDGQPFVVNRLKEKAEELGVQFFWTTTAKQLVRGGVANGTEGRVEAVLAEDADGNLLQFKGAKAIVLATGDFSCDRDMMAKYAPQAYDWVMNFDDENMDPENGKVYGGLYKGDGQKMGLWVGAAWQKAFPCAAMAAGSFGGVDNIGFLINQAGKRFMAESVTGGYASLAYNHAPNNTIYQIWDSAYAETGAPWPKRKTAYKTPLNTPEEMIETWDAAVEEGKYVKAETVEEVISLLGLPAETVDELNKYNEYCKAGEDLDFHKWPEFLHEIATPPFYGATSEVSHNILSVMGGLRTDIDMHVCNENDEPIPGLYNVGTMIGDAYASTYSFRLPGHNLGMNCICYGYLTGKYIAENE